MITFALTTSGKALNILKRLDFFIYINYNMTEIYMSVKDYARKIKKSEKTVYNWIESGKIDKDRIKKILNTTLIKV